ncbi:MAG TPA: hypothetical protein VER14_07565 [Phototrophicaceae bacterium]|nr:hypothetical protein [Phototrophicaceae bacterium]
MNECKPKGIYFINIVILNLLLTIEGGSNYYSSSTIKVAETSQNYLG